MNTSGKNLEQHEILKVKLLSNLDEDIDKHMFLWNKLADVDTLLIRRRKDENIGDRKNEIMRANKTPQSDSTMQWDDTETDEILRDSFGNLVMISQGLNVWFQLQPKAKHIYGREIRSSC